MSTCKPKIRTPNPFYKFVRDIINVPGFVSVVEFLSTDIKVLFPIYRDPNHH